MKYLLVLFSLAFAAGAMAQNGVYETYKDYKADKLLKMDAYDDFTQTGKVVFKQGGKKEKFDLGEIWGFVVNGDLYRGIKESKLAAGVAYKVINDEKFVYYENGQAHLTALEDKHGVGYYEGALFFVSKDLESKILPVTRFSFKKIKEEIPNCQPMLDCVDDVDRHERKDREDKFRKCILDFQKK
ncbi:MAG: hypothetical protein IT258_19870 [Saprospiraceae bacterium]|nr:hypothetical protein [Saprospiraceae bacterium]